MANQKRVFHPCDQVFFDDSDNGIHSGFYCVRVASLEEYQHAESTYTLINGEGREVEAMNFELRLAGAPR